jgi:hypothetical protein
VTIPLNDLLVSLKWTEEGTQIPEHAKAQFAELAAAQAALVAGPGAGMGGRLGGPNQFQSGWASSSQILAQMARDAGNSTRAVTQLSSATMGAERAAVSHVRGLNFLRTAMTGVALEATNTAGPLGRLASAALLFAGGSGLVLGVAAGVAVIVGGYNQLHKAAFEAAQAHIELDVSMRKTLAGIQATPLQLRAYEAGLISLKDRLRELQAPTSGAGTHTAKIGDVFPIFGFLFGEEASNQTNTPAMENVRRQIELITQAIARMTAEIEKADRETMQLLRAGDIARFRFPDFIPTPFVGTREFGRVGALPEAGFGDFGPNAPVAADPFRVRSPRSLGPQFSGFDPGPGSNERARLGVTFPAPDFPKFGSSGAVGLNKSFGAGQAAVEQERYGRALEFTRGVLIRAMTPQQIFAAGIEQLQVAFRAGAIDSTSMKEAIEELNKEMGKAKQQSKILAVAIVGAVSGTIAAIIQGGSGSSIVGGILGTIGGIVGIGNPVLGAGLAGLGTIISATGSRGVSIDRYSKEALDQLKGIPNGPQRIDFSVIAASTGEIVERVIYELGQRQRNGAVRRALPGYALTG